MTQSPNSPWTMAFYVLVVYKILRADKFFCQLDVFLGSCGIGSNGLCHIYLCTQHNLGFPLEISLSSSVSTHIDPPNSAFLN